MQSSARVPLTLPWEEPPLSLVFGSDNHLPSVPRVDRVGPRVDHAAGVVAGECSSNPEVSRLSSASNHYMSVSCKAPDVRGKLEPRDELSLYVQRFEMSWHATTMPHLWVASCVCMTGLSGWSLLPRPWGGKLCPLLRRGRLRSTPLSYGVRAMVTRRSRSRVAQSSHTSRILSRGTVRSLGFRVQWSA